MNDEEIQQLITDLRRMLIDNGFGRVADEAETDLFLNVAPRIRALALIDAAEGVSVSLAQVELSTLDALGLDEINFEPDGKDLPEGEEYVDGALASEALIGSDRLRGEERRVKLKQLADQHSAFALLRKRLDGDE